MTVDVRPLVKVEDATSRSIVEALVRLLLGVWSGAEYTDRDDVQARALRSAELVQAAQRQARRGMDAYNRQVFERLDVDFPVPDKTALDDYPREGVTPEKVWERPAEAYRYARSRGKSDAEAREAAEKKIERLARDEVNLARRDQAARTYQKAERVTGYRRVIHPELSESGVCGLCVAAATRVYGKADLLPIHPGCVCTVAPITATSDPGAWMNDLDLRALYKAAGSTGQQDLSNVRVREFVDGEMGPMLTSYGKEIPEGETRKRREGGRSTPRARYQQVEALEERLEAYRAQLARLKGRKGDLVALQRRNIESAIRGTERALKEARAA